jgi:3-deoxy-D-arabino-heptulosonate 7-phosphate (DAHP) synthase
MCEYWFKFKKKQKNNTKKIIRKDGKQERNENMVERFNLTHPFVIAGPCSAETEEQVLKIAHELKDS